MARILCVDDDVSVVGLKRSMLERAGHLVDVSASAGSAIRMLSALPYDVLVTDWRLDEEDASRVIQAAKRNTEILVVVVSGFVAEAFQSSGIVADIYLDKPVDPVELLKILEVLLVKHKR